MEYGGQRSEVGGRRLDRARAREEKEIDSEYRVYRSTERVEDYVTRYPN